MSFENLSILAFSSSLNTLFFQTVAYFLCILTTMRVFFFPTLSYQSSVPMNYPICSYQLSERIRDSLESVAFWKSSAVFTSSLLNIMTAMPSVWRDDSSARGGSEDERQTQRRLELSLNHYWLCLVTAFSSPYLAPFKRGFIFVPPSYRLVLVKIKEERRAN